jgi:hypothetical protein
MYDDEMSKPCDVAPMGRTLTPVLLTLQRRRENLLKELSNLNNAIEALEMNPEVTKVLELLHKVNQY